MKIVFKFGLLIMEFSTVTASSFFISIISGANDCTCLVYTSETFLFSLKLLLVEKKLLYFITVSIFSCSFSIFLRYSVPC